MEYEALTKGYNFSKLFTLWLTLHATEKNPVYIYKTKVFTYFTTSPAKSKTFVISTLVLKSALSSAPSTASAAPSASVFSAPFVELEPSDVELLSAFSGSSKIELNKLDRGLGLATAVSLFSVSLGVGSKSELSLLLGLVSSLGLSVSLLEGRLEKSPAILEEGLGGTGLALLLTSDLNPETKLKLVYNPKNSIICSIAIFQCNAYFIIIPFFICITPLKMKLLAKFFI